MCMQKLSTDQPTLTERGRKTPPASAAKQKLATPVASRRHEPNPQSAATRKNGKPKESARTRRKKPEKATAAAGKKPMSAPNAPRTEAAEAAVPDPPLQSPHRRVKFAEAMRMHGMDELTVAQKHCAFFGHLEVDKTLSETDKLLYEMLGDFVKHLQGPPPAAAARGASVMTPTSDVPIQMIFQVPRPERDVPYVSRAGSPMQAANASAQSSTDSPDSAADSPDSATDSPDAAAGWPDAAAGEGAESFGERPPESGA